MKKKILIGSILLAICIVIGSATYLIKFKNDKAPINTPQSEIKKEESPKEESTPQNIALNPSKYENKDISIRGIVIKDAMGAYLIRGVDRGETVTLNLDFSKSNIKNMDDFSAEFVTRDGKYFLKSGQEAKPMVVIGKITGQTADNKMKAQLTVGSITH